MVCAKLPQTSLRVGISDARPALDVEAELVILATVKDDLTLAAIFVDFENIYYFIKNRSPESLDSSETAITTIRNLRSNLLNDLKKQCIVQHAYADFERIGGSPQGAFYLIGMETHNVLSTDHKNAADMRLCIDAMETLYTRPEITTFVFVAGDRDYIPVVQHLKKHAKSVLVVSFKGSVSGDLLQVAEERNFIDAATVLPEGIVLGEALQPQPAKKPVESVPTAASPPPAAKTKQAPTFQKPRRLDSDDERDALSIMLQHFGDKSEIWMTPYLHRQRSEMPHLAEYERRALITELREKGAISVEKRPGDQGDFSVIVINYDHPDVRELCPG